jgi:ribosome-associated toxin RatA of RatAB toxin-antitoxin module
MLPSEMKISRSIVINAVPEKIFMQVNDFKNWQNWSPWYPIDPNAKYTYSENTIGIDARMSWQSEHGSVGNGEMVINFTEENKIIRYALFFPDFEQTHEGQFELTPVEGGTKVTWSDYSDMKSNLVMRYIAALIKSGIEEDFSKGLTNLKLVCEK